MNRIFVDTSAWIALLNKNEQCHLEAVDIYENRLNAYVIVVSNFVVAETYTWLRKKTNSEIALSFLNCIKEKEKLNQLEVVYATIEIEEEASRLLDKYSDQLFSYADAVSFVIMEKEKITEAFSYDRHFMTAGFTTINQLGP